MSISKSSWILPIVALLGGCAASPVPELATGSAVRQMMSAQTADPAASERNADRAPQGTDPARANNAINAMRDGVTRPESRASGSMPNAGATGDIGAR